jgi:hypothetical protein
MGMPQMGARGLPGKRVDAIRAGIIPIIFIVLLPHKMHFSFFDPECRGVT